MCYVRTPGSSYITHLRSAVTAGLLTHIPSTSQQPGTQTALLNDGMTVFASDRTATTHRRLSKNPVRSAKAVGQIFVVVGFFL